ncbi:MAG: hypothetical protein K1563_18260 [Candidatus Thiodiazotropha sp. (ex. Lucinisca nassula)]|nr:hypothetical protein [Candidatus Thiodiazotropha sp. (ex. Lucinisca nassula)]MBW9275625.1 hypothetical protein [Candidatus Thiodiazotropha sp. (ex. Lucinisca nassula)]
MEERTNRYIFFIAPFLSVACLFGYLLIESISINVRVLVVLYWTAVLIAFISLFFNSKNQSVKISSVVIVPALLFVPSPAIWAWTAWSINGFAP